MNSRAIRLAVALVTFSLLPSPASSQEGSWTFRGTGEFGIFFSTRDLGKNVGNIPEITVLQVSSRMDPSPLLGGGVEAISPSRGMMFRGVVKSTTGATASGMVILCNLLTGTLCIDREVDARMTLFSGEIYFLQGDPERPFRHQFMIGAGLRSYQFTVQACNPNVGNPDEFTICELVRGIYEDQASAQPFIQFGFGFEWDSGPVSFTARIADLIGPYSGGSGQAEGEFQNDVFLMGGLSFRVR